MDKVTDKIASKHLGKKTDGSEKYDPSLLVAIPRIENREQYNIDNNNLPFIGYDIWHAYEFSCMTNNGLPVTKVIKLKYSCESNYIVESKSLKLYLNSFNMSRFGNSTGECIQICKNFIENDLSEALKTKVEINFLDDNTLTSKLFDSYQDIIKLIDEKSVIIEKFKEAPNVLEVENTIETKKYKLMFNSLRSNCRVTHQPDFGDVFIYYKSNRHIKEHALIKYLCSFRSEYHFHEECVEMIFKRLYDLLDKNDELMVTALYTRRGGIDICPTRWTKNLSNNDTSVLIDINKFARKGIKQ